MNEQPQIDSQPAAERNPRRGRLIAPVQHEARSDAPAASEHLHDPSEPSNEILTASALVELEEELAGVDARVELTRKVPDVRDQIYIFDRQLASLDSRIELLGKEVETMKCAHKEQRDFVKKAAAYRDQITVNIDRLEAASIDEDGASFRRLVDFHEAILAAEWWIENEQRKTDAFKSRLEQLSERHGQFVAEARPIRSNLAELNAKVKSVQTKQQDAARWS